MACHLLGKKKEDKSDRQGYWAAFINGFLRLISKILCIAFESIKSSAG